MTLCHYWDMDVKAFIAFQGMTDPQLSARYGFDRSYWNHLRHGSKALSRAAALKIWRRDGLKVGPLECLSDDEVALLDRMEQAA